MRFTGPNTLHQPGEKIDLNKTPDGNRMTLLVAEVGDPIPWTKPDDPIITPAAANKPFVPKNPPLWVGPYSNVINVAFADVHAMSLKPDLSSEVVSSLIYSNDGKVLTDRDEMAAVIPAQQESEDIKELQQNLHDMTEALVQLTKEETKLREDLAKLSKLSTDPAARLAEEVMELSTQFNGIRARIRNLRDQVDKAKK